MVDVVLLSTVCIADFFLGTFVLANNPKARLNRYLAFLCYTLAIWNTVTFFEDTDFGHRIIHLLAALDFAFASLMICLFFLFCYEISQKKLRILPALITGITVVSILSALINRTVQTTFKDGDVHFVPKTGYKVVLLLIVSGLLSGLVLLLIRYKHAVGRNKLQIKYIFSGLFLTAFFIVLTNVLLPNFQTVPPQVTRLGIYSTIFFVGASAYTIIKHRFLDIRLVVARSVAYVLSISVIVGLYVLLTLVITNVIAKKSLDTGLRITLALSSVISALSFPYVKHFFDRISNSIFYRDAYEPQELLDELNTVLVSKLELAELLKDISKTINKYLKSDFASFTIHAPSKKHLDFSSINQPLLREEDLKYLHKAIMPNRTRALLVSDLEASKSSDLLCQHSIDAVISLVTHKEEVGYLLLGQKKSGNIYSEQDLKMMEIIGEELAIAIQNALRFEEIKQFNITLQQKVDEATTELRHANTKLKELDKTKDEFISMASHQLRTPLTTIKGYLSMVLEGDAGEVKPKQQEMIQQSFDSASRMVYLIADLLNVSRLQSGKFVITNKPTNLADVVEGEVKQLAEQAKNRKIAMTYDKPKDFPSLNLDEDKIRQVVMNLLDNALYYTPSGGTVTVMLAATPDSVSYTVTDTGVGVPKAVQPHLFAKFYRADSARKMRPDGTGLGLYMAKKVITAQGGGIIFKSEEGKGSTFGFTIPRKGNEVKG